MPELRVREVRPDDQQRVAAGHQLVAGPGAEESDRTGHIGQIIRQDVLAQQRLGHAGAGEVRDLPNLVGRVAGALSDEDRHP
jgi:hypothetical protein